MVKDDQGKPYTVRYEAVNAMLLNEFLKNHRTVLEQGEEITALRAELEEQEAFIEKVDNKVGPDRAAARTVVCNR